MDFKEQFIMEFGSDEDKQALQSKLKKIRDLWNKDQIVRNEIYELYKEKYQDRVNQIKEKLSNMNIIKNESSIYIKIDGNNYLCIGGHHCVIKKMFTENWLFDEYKETTWKEVSSVFLKYLIYHLATIDKYEKNAIQIAIDKIPINNIQLLKDGLYKEIDKMLSKN